MQRNSILAVSFIYKIALPVVLLLALLLPAAPAQALAQVKIIVHYIEGIFVPEKAAYQVQVYLSVMDSAGRPLKNLDASNFTVSEDSLKYEVSSVTVATQPVSIVFLLDNSLSMANSMDSARLAVRNFVKALSPGDQVALVTFNEKINREIEFTSDFEQVRGVLDKVKTQASGTCLFDAAYEAIQLAGSEPSGRRAIILLTDGVDELTSGKGCSTHMIDDVISAAASGSTRVPIYTLGLGSRIDEQSLARMADLTGGDYLKSPDASRLGRLFDGLSDALKSQYALTYYSTGAPGPHKVIVEVNDHSSKDRDMRDYTLPPMPASLSIVSPTQDQQVAGELKMEVSLSTQGKTIRQVIFFIDGREAAFDDTAPYTRELESLPAGKHTLAVQAIDEDYNEVARGSVSFAMLAGPTPKVEITSTVRAVAAVSTEAPASSTAAAPAATAASAPPNRLPAILIGAALIGILLAAGIATLVMVRRKRPAAAQPGWDAQPGWSAQPGGQPFGAPAQPGLQDRHARAQGAGRPVAGAPAVPVPDVLATLTVLGSDDPMLVDQVLNITQPTTQLGRGAQNDIIFPKDTPVSRQHAVIECKGGQFFLSEVCIPDDTGALKRPRYGTFVNEKPLQLVPFQLRSGSVIRLGPRVKLAFRLPHRPGDDLTMDGEDATQDGEMATLDGFDDATKDGSPTPARPADQEKTLADNN